jgi:hypothetical protein
MEKVKKVKKPTTVTTVTPITPVVRVVRLSFRLENQNQEKITTSISLKDKIISFWFLTGSRKEDFSPENWKNILYEFLTPLLKEAFLGSKGSKDTKDTKGSTTSLSAIAFDLLLKDSLETLGFTLKDFKRYNKISKIVSNSIKPTVDINIDLETDLKKVKKKIKKKVKKKALNLKKAKSNS